MSSAMGRREIEAGERQGAVRDRTGRCEDSECAGRFSQLRNLSYWYWEGRHWCGTCFRREVRERTLLHGPEAAAQAAADGHPYADAVTRYDPAARMALGYDPAKQGPRAGVRSKRTGLLRGFGG